MWSCPNRRACCITAYGRFYGNSICDAAFDCNRNHHTNGYGDMDAAPNTIDYTDIHTDSDSNAYEYAKAHAHPDTDANSHPPAHSYSIANFPLGNELRERVGGIHI